MEFSFLDFDEAGGDFESGEDYLEIMESVGGLGVGDGVAVGAGVELLGDAVELDALGEEAVHRVS